MLPKRFVNLGVTAWCSRAIPCAMTSKRLLAVKSSVSFSVPAGGSPVGELARSLKPGGSIAVYAFKLRLPVLSPEFLFINLNLHGFWIVNWMRNAPSTGFRSFTKSWPTWWRMAHCPRPSSKCIPSTNSSRRSIAP